MVCLAQRKNSMQKRLKKLAIVVSGWHYPMGFYENIAKQQLPNGWIVEMFVVSHRDPKFAEKKVFDKKTRRGKLDALLYKKLATKKDIESLGFEYQEEPNTIGDWGNSNQWLDTHDYKKYDLFLFTHDDNLITSDNMLTQICSVYDNNWLIMTNSIGMPPGSLRGSFEFFKKEMLDKIGGKFDLSKVSLDQTGKTKNPLGWSDLYDWNNTVTPLTDFITKKKLWNRIQTLSPYYRVSLYCIEGERGLISSTQPMNNPYEEEGLDKLQEIGII